MCKGLISQLIRTYIRKELLCCDCILSDREIQRSMKIKRQRLTTICDIKETTSYVGMKNYVELGTLKWKLQFRF